MLRSVARNLITFQDLEECVDKGAPECSERDLLLITIFFLTLFNFSSNFALFPWHEHFYNPINSDESNQAFLEYICGSPEIWPECQAIAVSAIIFCRLASDVKRF